MGIRKTLIDLTGQIFTRLTVLERAPSTISNAGRRDTMWKCKCTCGTIKAVHAKGLRNKSIQSCGCLRGEVTKRKKSISTEQQRLYNLKRYEAKRRNDIPFLLTEEEFFAIVTSECYYCGLPPSQTYSLRRGERTVVMLYSGIDRKDNDLGYTNTNSLPCCTICNQIKLAQTYDAFLERISKIYNRLCV